MGAVLRATYADLAPKNDPQRLIVYDRLWRVSADIPQIAAVSIPNVLRFGGFDKSDDPPPFVDRRRAAQLLAEQLCCTNLRTFPWGAERHRRKAISARSFIVHFKSERVERETANDNDLALMRRLDEFFIAWPFVGSRRMKAMLRAEGKTINRKRAQRLTRLMGIAALGPKPTTT